MEATTAVPVSHTSALARLVWGGILTALPHRLLRRLGRPTALAVATLRVLGARHLAQAALTLRRSTPAVLVLGVAADGLHALTAVAFAALGPRRQRRIALLDSGMAGGWLLLDLCAVRRPQGGPDAGGDHHGGGAGLREPPRRVGCCSCSAPPRLRCRCRLLPVEHRWEWSVSAWSSAGCST